jgi:hypothetical protein
MIQSDTPNYDPRTDRAQTVAGAKARYVDPDCQYSLADLEHDVRRILTEGEHPDRPPLLEGVTLYR